MNWLVVDKIIKGALVEDGSYGDITTEAIIDKQNLCSVDLIAKENGIIAGLDVFKRVFQILGDVEVNSFIKDGEEVNKGDIIGKVSGKAVNILTGERVALNLIQRMSGIATLTNKFVKQLEGTNTKILDTRKTTPNLRVLEKYAVKVGGGVNHRYNLSDGILIKDNHISAAGNIKEAILKVRKYSPFVRKVEVEVESLDQVKEALQAEADIIMLDNMDIYTMKKAVELINNRAIIEASGNMNINSIKEVASTGVDYISVGSLTHSVKALDISLKNLRNI
ncbi:carboxylating nicotinate-nucleotide diphosphorylase [Haloimpatiens sp. FM7330]|uniref:carboxylating nicotinate-nucleotide diphosphorylase n=1 Tax=Haloimpatiens sp. FM7330 TaxID=3298610 RepID=UPI00362CF2CF